MTVGEKIKFYREARNMTVAQLSEKAELAIDNIRKYESGARNPKLDALSKTATALGVNLNTLLDIDLKTPSGCAPYLLPFSSKVILCRVFSAVGQNTLKRLTI
ncbi:MAG: helix-turn-helix domain-containing protein [Lachnospiraceae bacterium]|nr:helix-turn-helix domain-containing protein [Lachnospiraceae bacterium]